MRFNHSAALWETGYRERGCGGRKVERPCAASAARRVDVSTLGSDSTGMWHKDPLMAVASQAIETRLMEAWCVMARCALLEIKNASARLAGVVSSTFLW
jgi:hypothetical protein